MRLYSFRIQNFKSIRDTGEIKVSIEDNVTILAGQNEAGKSSVLEALDFFETGKFSELHRYDDLHPRVEVAYELNTEELERVKQSGSKELADYVKGNRFKFVRGSVDEDDFAELKYINNDEMREIVAEIKAAQAETESDEEDSEPKEEYSVNIFFDMRPSFVFYGSFAEDTLPSVVKASELSAIRSVGDFEKVFDISFSDLLKITNPSQRKHKLNKLNERASDNLNTYWSQSIEGEGSTYKFEIDLNIQKSTPSAPSLESSVTFLISQDNVNPPLHFEQKSKGFRWFSNFNLRLRAHQSSEDDLSKIILLIDEPGEGLHEVAQQNAKAVLNELAEKGTQVVFSTHQAQMLREEDNEVKLSRIKLVTKTPEKGTELQNVTQRITQAGFMDAMSPVRTAMGLVSIDATSLMSGKVQVVVEGVTDYYYYKALFKLADKQDLAVFIPSTGADQVSNIFAILYGWGLNPKAIVDDDRQGTTAYNKIRTKILPTMTDGEIEKVIIKNASCPGVEDILTATEFGEFAKSIVTIDAKKSNHENAGSSKELLGRSFLDMVDSGTFTTEMLSDETKSRLELLTKFVEMK